MLFSWIKTNLELLVAIPSGTFTAYKATLLVDPIISIAVGVITAALSTIVVHYIKKHLNKNKPPHA